MTRCLLAAGLLLLLWATPIHAQAVIEARFTVDNGTPLVGQPVTIMLTANVPQGIAITGWPEIPPKWPPFDVRDISDLSISENADGSALYEQSLTVMLWDVGEYQTPEINIQYELVGEGQTRTQPIVPAFFTVPSVLDPEDTALRPFAPPITLPYLSPMLIAAAAGGSIVALALLLQRLARGQRAHVPQPPTALTPAKLALAELRRIASRNLAPVLLYQSVADTLRGYTQSQYNVQALDMTTWELMNALRSRVPDATQSELQRMLEQADLVKFARYTPDTDAAQKYLESAGRWLKAQDEP